MGKKTRYGVRLGLEVGNDLVGIKSGGQRGLGRYTGCASCSKFVGIDLIGWNVWTQSKFGVFHKRCG